MQISFKGKNLIVAGGSRGIGRSIALGFAAAGANVSICARGAEGVEKTVAEIKKLAAPHDGKAHGASCDLADGAAIKKYIADAAAALGGINVLVNNASGFGRTDDEAGWAQSVSIDVMATVRASNESIPIMERSGGGSIINISSISGLTPSLRTPPYGAVKAAVIQYTKTQALALSKKNIRVNCIAPGSIFFEGGTWDNAKKNNPKLYEGIMSSIPWGRYGTPEEVATVALFLASDMASWVTGQTIAVDGGQVLS
jgi:3-oxoacyl-[acyl-carrier protein] reductase